LLQEIREILSFHFFTRVSGIRVRQPGGTDGQTPAKQPMIESPVGCVGRAVQKVRLLQEKVVNPPVPPGVRIVGAGGFEVGLDRIAALRQRRLSAIARNISTSARTPGAVGQTRQHNAGSKQSIHFKRFHKSKFSMVDSFLFLHRGTSRRPVSSKKSLVEATLS